MAEVIVDKRLIRNRKEKQRRDKMASAFKQLRTQIGFGDLKISQHAVLEHTIQLIQNSNASTPLIKVVESDNWKPTFISNDDFIRLVLEAYQGFIIMMTSSGKILHATNSITHVLGFTPQEVVDFPLAVLLSDSEQAKIYNTLFQLQSSDINRNTVAMQCLMYCKNKNAVQAFQAVNIVVTSSCQPYKGPNVNCNKATKRSSLRGSKLQFCLQKMYLALVCLQKPQLLTREISFSPSATDEFTSILSLEGNFLFLDKKASEFIGYLSLDLVGNLFYEYIHFDDLPMLNACFQSLLVTTRATTGYYRFLTKGSQWIWLQSTFHISNLQWRSASEYVVSKHSLIDPLIEDTKTKQAMSFTGYAARRTTNALVSAPISDTRNSIAVCSDSSNEHLSEVPTVRNDVGAFRNRTLSLDSKASTSSADSGIGWSELHTSDDANFSFDSPKQASCCHYNSSEVQSHPAYDI